MLDSPAYIGSSNAAKTALIELERLHNGSNNSNIRFAGVDGARLGLQRRTTERALAELQRRGFLVAMGPANGKHRKWRLTAHPANGNPATKEFTFWSESWSENSLARPDFDAGKGLTVPILTHSGISTELVQPRLAPEIGQNAGETANQPVPILTLANVNGGTHIDARCSDRYIEPSDSCFPEKVAESGASTENLFGGDLPIITSPQDQLRFELHQVFQQQRGTQSAVATALGVSRSRLSNAFAGRDRFTTIAAAALRQWLDGDPMPANCRRSLRRWPRRWPMRHEDGRKHAH